MEIGIFSVENSMPSFFTQTPILIHPPDEDYLTFKKSVQVL